MAAIDNLFVALDERQIVERVTRDHDDFRASYSLHSNTVPTFDEFGDVIGDYYGAHHSRCVSRGGSLARHEAASRAKEILERDYRRRDGDILTAFNDASAGTNGSLRRMLDVIAEALKVDAVNQYIREVLDRYIVPNSWQDRLDMTRQFIARCGVSLGSSIDAETPARYARDIQFLVRSYSEALRDASAAFRRL